MKEYVVCISGGYLRDIQARLGREGMAYEDCEEDWENDDAWYDFSGPAYVGVYKAESEEETIEKAAQRYDYPKEILVVYAEFEVTKAC